MITYLRFGTSYMHRYLDRQVRQARQARQGRQDQPVHLEVLVRPVGLALWVHLEVKVHQASKGRKVHQVKVMAHRVRLVRKVQWVHLVPKARQGRKARKGRQGQRARPDHKDQKDQRVRPFSDKGEKMN